MRPARTAVVKLLVAVVHTTAYRTISVNIRMGGSIVGLVQMRPGIVAIVHNSVKTVSCTHDQDLITAVLSSYRQPRKRNSGLPV